MAAIIAQRLKKQKYQLFLFGSRALRKAKKSSDYDLAILAEKPLRLATLAQIEQDFEALPMLQKIDLIDIRSASSNLKSQIFKYGRLLDER